MALAVSARPGIAVDGKFFRLGKEKFHVKGIAYGPFAPNAQGLPFASPDQTALDLTQIQELGANLVRVYHAPPQWFLDLAEARGLKVMLDIPWNRHLCLDTETRRAEAREVVRHTVLSCARHPAIFAYSIANEIPPDIVRWTGPTVLAKFIDELIDEARRADPGCLCTFANFPPTEFLQPQNLDFLCFNVYLHQPRAFKRYLSRLQMMAGPKPLLLGEFGMDSIREGEDRKCEMLSWQIELAFRGGLAGTIAFTYTDDWFKDGRAIENWEMGLVTRDRQIKPSYRAVQRQFKAAPHFPLARSPKVSVVVASYNGSRTLKTCLESLQRLNYPSYETLLIDDGSTDSTAQIAGAFPGVRYIKLDQNRGLSAARNAGIAAATGEIIAFTDSDCRADEDWLYYLVGDCLDGDFAAAGGPNLLPPEDSAVAAAVMVSPGGPAHVMLNDREAEHIPGCNMACYKWVLEEIGGFDLAFRKAGDDVDLCWRLQQAGYRIGFSPSGFVWHYRRSTIRAYLRQQRGYGEAEALLIQKHPENFNRLGSGTWRGRIYSTSKLTVEIQPPVIYHGQFASAGFQKLYASGPATILTLCTTLEYYLFIALPLCILSTIFHLILPLAIAGVLLPLAVCATAAAQAALPRNKREWWSRPLVALLFLLQPIVRGWARYRVRLAVHPSRLASRESLDSLALRGSTQPLRETKYWAEHRIDRLDFMATILQRLEAKGWSHRVDIGWSDFDVEVYGSRWSCLQLATVAEDHRGNRQMIRCRLSTTVSLTARVALLAMVAVELLVIGLKPSWHPWSWLMLGSIPAFLWFLRFDQRNLRSIFTIFLDQLAQERGLLKIHSEPASPSGAA